MQIQQKTFVITGASSGLGFATAQRLLSLGAKIALLDINAELGAVALHELKSPDAVFYPVDVTDETMIEETFAQIYASFGAIHGLVNCAGIAPAQRVLAKDGKANPLATFRSVIDVNLIGSFNTSRVAAQYMTKNITKNMDQSHSESDGIIINTASVAGYEGQIGQTAYAASKAGIIGLCLAMARDLASQKIRVNTVAPGIMSTPMLQAMPDNVQETLASTVVHPKRLGIPEEFAKLVTHIIENDYINGETIRLDGALRMGPK